MVADVKTEVKEETGAASRGQAVAPGTAKPVENEEDDKGQLVRLIPAAPLDSALGIAEASADPRPRDSREDRYCNKCWEVFRKRDLIVSDDRR